MADKKVNITVEADTSGAVKHIEELYGALADVNNVMKPISTLAKEAGQGLDAIAKSKEATPAQQNAIKDLVPVLQILKDSTSLATGEMKGLEKSIKNVASARNVLARYSKTGSSLFGSVSNMGDDWSREYEKALKAQLPHVDTKEGIAIKNANAVLERSLLSLGSGYNDTSAAYGKKAIYYQQATKNIGELQKAMKAVIDSGKGSDEIVGKLNNRINDLSKVSAKASNSIGNIWKRMKSNIVAFSTTMVFGKALHLLLSTIPSLFAKASKAASDAAEANNLYAQTFDRIPNIAEEASGRVQKTFSLAESTANTAIGTFAQYMIGLGKTQSEALKFGEQATKVFLDIRSFKNIEGDLNQFMQKAMSGLAGNTENFRTMGLAINAAAAKERLMSKGLGDLTGNAKRAAIAQEYLNMVIEQSQDAIGDFQRNYYSTQNTNQRLSEQWKSWKENFGQGLNNAFDPIKQFFADMLESANSLRNIIEDINTAASANKLEGTKTNGTQFSDFRLNRMWEHAYLSARWQKGEEARIAKGSTNISSEEQISAYVDAAHDTLKAMAEELKVPAEKLASVVNMGNQVTSALRQSVTEFGKSIDDEIAKGKQIQETIISALDSLNASTTSLADAQEKVQSNRHLVPSSWRSMLTPYQRATGDYDQADVMGDWLKELRKQYNALASTNVELEQNNKELDKNTTAYQNNEAAIRKNRKSMELLATQAKKASKTIDELKQATKDAKEELKKQTKAKDDFTEFNGGLRKDYSVNSFKTNLKDDPLASAKNERMTNIGKLFDFYKKAKDAGVAQKELDAQFNQGLSYIKKSYRQAVSNAIDNMDYSKLSKVVKDKTNDKEIREEALKARHAATAKFASKNALNVANSATGGLLNAGIQGAAAGGPWGAIIGVIAELITELEVFKKVCEPVELLVDAINDSLSPFEPMIDMLNQSLSALFKALLPISPVTRILSSALTGFGYVIGSVANIIKTAYELTSGIVKDVFNGIRRSAGAIGSFLKHLVNPFKWNKLAGDIDDMKKAWSFNETGEALSNWKDTQKNLYEQLKDTNKAIWSIEESSSTTAKNTAKDNSKLQAWKELMDAGYLTGAQFSVMSRNYNGVGYKFGSPSLNASNFGAVAGSGRTVTIGQVTIKIEGSGDPEAVARAVERILRNRAVYGVSA